MKKLTFQALALLLAVTAGFAQDNAPAVKESAGGNLFFAKATLDLYSAYVWRGLVLNDEPVWQPGATVGADLNDFGKLYLGTWSNFDATKRNGKTAFGGLNELDFTAGYTVDLGDFSLGAGHRWYTFPKANGPDYGGSTREAFATLAYKNDFVVPFIEGHYDYNVAEGVYSLVGLRKEVMVGDRLTVGAEVSVGGGSEGYTSFQFGGREGKMWLVDGNAALLAKYDLTENIFIGARLAWMSLMDDRLKGAAHRDNILWGGINLGVAF